MPIPIWHSQKSRELLINFREIESCPMSEHVNTQALIYPATFLSGKGVRLAASD